MAANITRRSARVAERIKVELMEIIIRGGVRDPASAGVYVTDVTITPDLKRASVYVRLTEIEPSRERREAAVQALTRASGYLRKELAPRLKLKYLPELSFAWDDHVEKATRVEVLLMEISQEKRGENGPTGGK
jgi:ribosome-binding factor A